MSALTLSMIAKLEAGQAKTELRALQGEVTKTSAAAKSFGADAKGAGAGVDSLGDQSALAAAKVKALAEAEMVAARASGALHQANTVSVGSLRGFSGMAGSAGQMVGRFGTAMRSMGATIGAVGGQVAGTLITMFNPITLGTTAILTVGTAMAAWLLDTKDDAAAAADAIDALKKRVGEVDDVLGRIERFNFDTALDGMDADAARIRGQFDSILMVIGQVQAASLQAALAKVKEQSDLVQAMKDNAYQADMAGRFGTEAPAFDAMGLNSLYEAKLVLIAIRDIEGSTREEILQSVEAQTEKLMLLGLLTPAVQEQLALIAEQLGLDKEINQQMKESKAAADETQASLALSLSAARALAGAGIASAIERALGPASRLSSILQTAAGWFGLATAGAGGTGITATGTASVGLPKPPPVLGYSGGTGRINLGISTGGGTGSGGGASAAKAERDAVAELITKLQEEQEVLRTTDPLKAEMLKYRKELAEATAAERGQIEQLITARMREEAQLKANKDLTDLLNSSTADLLDGLIVKGMKAGDVMRSLLSSLLSSGIQAFTKGTGPLAGILGIQGGLFGGGIARKADGGLITGAGGPRADLVPIMASAGEFMMTGDATRRYRPVLERMNAGGVPGFARGGMIGAARGADTAFGGRGGTVINNYITVSGATGNAEIQDMVASGVSAGIRMNNREMVPLIVKDTLRNQRVAGR